MALTAIAGPITNMILGGVGASLYSIAEFLQTDIIPEYITTLTNFAYYDALVMVINALLLYFGLINFIYAFFNLIPLPPFDGSRFFFTFLPFKWYFGIMKYERYIMFGVLILFMISSRFLPFSPMEILARISFGVVEAGSDKLLEVLFQAINGFTT